MTLDDYEKALLGLGVTAMGALMALVRGADSKRIDLLETKQNRMEDSIQESRERLSEQIADLRKDVDRKHDHLVGLITSRSNT